MAHVVLEDKSTLDVKTPASGRHWFL